MGVASVTRCGPCEVLKSWDVPAPRAIGRRIAHRRGTRRALGGDAIRQGRAGDYFEARCLGSYAVRDPVCCRVFLKTAKEAPDAGR